MTTVARSLVIVGALLLFGLLADAVARRTPLPRVTLLMLLGLPAGPVVLDFLPPSRDAWFTVSATIALVMIGFLLGGEFTYRHVKELEGVVLRLALIESVVTAAAIGIGLTLLGASSIVALSLAGIGTADGNPEA